MWLKHVPPHGKKFESFTSRTPHRFKYSWVGTCASVVFFFISMKGKKMSTAIQKLEVQGLTLDSVVSEVEAIENKWETIPDANDRNGYELCKAGATEAQKIRTRLIAEKKSLKAQANDWKAMVDSTIGGLEERLKAKENLLRAEYKRVDTEKKRAKEEAARLEYERIFQLKQRIRDIETRGIVPFGETIENIEQRISDIRNVEICKEEYQEFYAEALKAREDTLRQLNSIWESECQKIEAERVAAEERARIEEEQRIERERLAEERAEQERVRKEQEEALRLERQKFEAEKREREEKERIEREQREREEMERRAEEQARIDAENEKLIEKYKQREREQFEAIKAEEKRIAEERAKVEKEKEEQRFIKEDAERIKREEEAQRRNAELLESNRNEMIAAMMGIDTIEEIADAIITGKIPHIKYVG